MTNTGSIERGNISPEKWYSIDKIIVKMASGKRLTRYAVCVNGCWKSNQQMTLREARDNVSTMRDNYIEKASETVEKVTDSTFKMVDDLASFASTLEDVGIVRKAERLRRIAGELENVNRALMEEIKK